MGNFGADDKFITAIIEMIDDEIKEERRRKAWDLANYDALGMQDRLYPLWQVAKIGAVAVVPLILISF